MKSLIVSLALIVACAAPALAQQTPATPAAATPTRIAADPAVEETETIWAKPGSLDLAATIYRPKSSSAPLPMLVDIHGGAWSSGSHEGDRLYCIELAKSGLVVISVDFRQAPQFQHPVSSADVAAAVRFARMNSKMLNANPLKIGLIGSSSGAHLALLESLRPEAPQHKGTPISNSPLSKTGANFAVHDEVTANVNYVVAMWPVSDPAARYRYAQRAGIESLKRGSESYFKDETNMWDASIPRIVTAGEAKTLPPILVVQPGNDSNIPQDMTFDLLHAWQARGGKLDYVFYPGQPHAFGHRPSEATTDLIKTVAAFIKRQNEK
ncbi:MAG TPA: alpha/beta hydrolase [Hyphomonadaceae bacterium]|jgi:acetyl esterase/lipase|nr:alpha/beta hydrolase [Hyphomonadaceae bacterium]